MTLDDAAQGIIVCLKRMQADYGSPVFNEWVVLSTAGGNRRIVAYCGPRIESFQDELAEDLQFLKRAMEDGVFSPGDFEFSREAEGTSHDAFIALGGRHFLLCNHTTKTVEEIAADPLWRKAQAHFVSLAEKIRSDPFTG